MTTYVCGDIHNNFLALNECLNLADFDFKIDTLIALGDVTDGEIAGASRVLTQLLNIKNLILIKGNHDAWTLSWMKTGMELPVHYHQGGYYTMLSYDFNRKNVPQSHIKLLESAIPYYIDSNNNIFVHGGFDERFPIDKQDPDLIMWNRELACNYSPNNVINQYNTVYVGHTSTEMYAVYEPIYHNNLVMMDTGAGWNGKLTFMNIETYEIYQSKLYSELYE